MALPSLERLSFGAMTPDDSWKQLQMVNDFVRYADAKAGLVLTLNGVLIAYGRVHPIIITFGTANVFLWLGLRVFKEDAKVMKMEYLHQ